LSRFSSVGSNEGAGSPLRYARNFELLVPYRLRVEHLRRGIIWDWCTALLAFLRIEGKNLSLDRVGKALG